MMILAAMGFAVARRSDIAAALAELEAEEWRALLPPVVTALDDESATVPVTIAGAQEDRASWTLMLESGEQREGSAALGDLQRLAEKRRAQRPPLPGGPSLPPGHHPPPGPLRPLSAEAAPLRAPPPRPPPPPP